MSKKGGLKVCKIKTLSPATSSNDLFMVQVLFSQLVEIPKKGSNEVTRIIKVVLLCRTQDGSDPSPLDEIELSRFVYGEKVAKSALKEFAPGKILLLKNVAHSLKKSGAYAILPHPYTINYYISQARDADHSKNLVIIDASKETENIPPPLSLFEFAVMNKFQVTELAHIREDGPRNYSVCGLIDYISDTKPPSKPGGSPSRNVTLFDVSNCVILISAFGEHVCELFDPVTKGSIVCLRGCTLSKFKGFSLSMNDSSHVIPCVTSNPWMSEYTDLYLEQVEGAHALTSNMPTERDEYLERDLGDIMDSVTALSEYEPRMRHRAQCRIVGFDTDLGDLWTFRCAFKNEQDGGKYCFAQTNLSSDSSWVCTAKREDGSLPSFEDETLEMIKERKHFGHVMNDVLLRTYITVSLVDDSLRPGQSLPAKLSHEALEKLLGLDSAGLLSLQTPEVCKRLRDIIFDQEKPYPPGSEQRLDFEQRKAKFHDHHYSMEWDEIAREYHKEFLVKATSKYMKPQQTAFVGGIDTNGLTIDSIQLVGSGDR